MKTICIISYQRTGTNWLSDILGASWLSPQHDTFSASEILSLDPLIFYWRMIFLLKYIYNVDTAVLDTFINIYDPGNFFLDAKSNMLIKRKINQKKPYHKNLLNTIQNKIYEKQLNFVFKIFPEHMITYDMDISYINNMSDYIIINYRNDILSSYISETKAMISGRWSSTEVNKKYQEKIYWNIIEYNKYCNDILKNKILILEDYYSKITKPVIKISYESIHKYNNQEEKIDFINQQFLNVDKNFKWIFNRENLYNKENTHKNIEDNFYNKDEFLRDLPSIKRFVYE